jgi:hypothetical protein
LCTAELPSEGAGRSKLPAAEETRRQGGRASFPRAAGDPDKENHRGVLRCFVCALGGRRCPHLSASSARLRSDGKFLRFRRSWINSKKSEKCPHLPTSSFHPQYSSLHVTFPFQTQVQMNLFPQSVNFMDRLNVSNLSFFFGSNISKSDCEWTVNGGNLEIIQICEQEKGDFSGSISFSISYIRLEIADWLLTNFSAEEILLKDCIFSMFNSSFETFIFLIFPSKLFIRFFQGFV